MTAALKRGRSSVGMANKFVQSPTLPFPDIPVINQPTLEDEVQRLIQRFNNLETLVERKADNNTLRSAIRISPEAILLEAKDVGVLGTFTVADIVSEQNGTTNGNVPLAITQIKGDVIRTGTILSNNWGLDAGSAYNLNDGTVTLGGSSSPKLLFDGTDLFVAGSITAGSIIAGSVTTDGVALSTIRNNAANALPSASFDSTLNSSLAAGVGSVLAGNTGDYRLTVSGTSIVASHKDINLSGLGSGYSGDLRTGLAVTGTGIAMGYNRKSDGAWVNAVAIGASGDISMLGTLTAGSVITGSVTVDGTQLSTIRSNAATGKAISDALLVSGSTILKGVIQPDTTGAVRIGTITWNSTTGALTGGTGLALTQWGIIGANSGAATFSIQASNGNAIFAGSITAAAVISGSATTDGVALSTIRSNAAAGKSLSDALLVSGTAILKGVIQPDASGAIRTGTITWNSSTGALTGGTGVAITKWGIIGANSGDATFTLQAATGAATFAGDITGASGTFGGNIQTSGFVRATGSATWGASVYGVDSSGITTNSGVIGTTVNGVGVWGESSSGGTGVRGRQVSGFGFGGDFRGNTGVRAEAFTSSGVCLNLPVGYITRPYSTTGRITLYNQTDGNPEYTFRYSFHA